MNPVYKDGAETEERRSCHPKAKAKGMKVKKAVVKMSTPQEDLHATHLLAT